MTLQLSLKVGHPKETAMFRKMGWSGSGWMDPLPTPSDPTPIPPPAPAKKRARKPRTLRQLKAVKVADMTAAERDVVINAACAKVAGDLKVTLKKLLR